MQGTEDEKKNKTIEVISLKARSGKIDNSEKKQCKKYRENRKI